MAFVIMTFSHCKKEASITIPKLVLKFVFDSTQVRLNNIGQPAAIVAGHAGQSPLFNKMSTYYVELAPSALTALGGGAILYKAPETTAGGPNTIDFEKSVLAGNNEEFVSVPIKDIAAGEYEWLRNPWPIRILT